MGQQENIPVGCVSPAFAIPVGGMMSPSVWFQVPSRGIWSQEQVSDPGEGGGSGPRVGSGAGGMTPTPCEQNVTVVKTLPSHNLVYGR